MSMDLQPPDHLSLLDLSGLPQSDSSLLASVDGAPGFLRALLVADGTVTSLLGAFFGEAIQVQTQVQGMVPLATDIPAVGLKAGDEAFARRVRLSGADTGRQYAAAFSLLNPAHMDGDLFHQLTREQVGMGEVLRNSGRGSYRRVQAVFDSDEDTVGRTYTVFLDGLPAILITEWFERAHF